MMVHQDQGKTMITVYIYLTTAVSWFVLKAWFVRVEKEPGK
jgi:hypothetical protein